MLEFNTWYLTADYSPYYVFWIDIENKGYYGWNHRNGKLQRLQEGKAGPSWALDLADVSGDTYKKKEPSLQNDDYRFIYYRSEDIK